ncbi:MAG: glycosyltransferase [Flavobacteriaceae bacterium]|nr:glycosyltransferase [Flavobacteriaceae bacterium]
MKTHNILILQGIVPDYREPLFNLLAEEYNITIGYTISTSEKKPKFKSYKIPHLRFKSFFFPTLKFLKSLSEYDLIIIMPDLHYFNYWIIPFLPIRSKIISFSIGMRASYKILYDVKRKKKLIDYIFLSILNKCDANIFYYKYPLDFWGRLIDKKKIYVANNTVNVLKTIPEISKKNSILFLGSLISGKGILELLEAYKKVIEQNQNFIIPLKIVGDGPLLSLIQDFIKKNDLNSKVIVLGGIYEEENQKNLFEEAICCISPNQAGLSVLKSFGYGVPFITKKTSITGGERLNIINFYNGILYDTKDELFQIINDIESKKDFYFKMGLNAMDYYKRGYTIDKMKDNFVKAIENTLK